MEVTDLFSKLRLIFHDPDEPGEMEVVCVCVRVRTRMCMCAHDWKGEGEYSFVNGLWLPLLSSHRKHAVREAVGRKSDVGWANLDAHSWFSCFLGQVS